VSGGDVDEVVGSVRAEWDRLVEWLARELPAALSHLRPPSSVPVPAALVDGSGGDWPEELVEWFGLHDGVEGYPFSDFVGGYRPISAAWALSSWEAYVASTDAWDDEDRAYAADLHAGEDTDVFDHRLVPIAEDGSGGALVVDLRPGPARGHVVRFDTETGTEYRGSSDPSIAALLHRVRTTLDRADRTAVFDGREDAPFEVSITSFRLYSEDEDDWSMPDEGVVMRPRASPVPSWSWARIGDAVGDTSWGEDAQAMAVIGPAFDYLLTLDRDELVAAAAEEPVSIGHSGFDCLLAACVDHAFDVHGLEAPGWAVERGRSLRDSWPVSDIPSAELRRRRETPDAFRRHGIALVWTR